MPRNRVDLKQRSMAHGASTTRESNLSTSEYTPALSFGQNPSGYPDEIIYSFIGSPNGRTISCTALKSTRRPDDGDLWSPSPRAWSRHKAHLTHKALWYKALRYTLRRRVKGFPTGSSARPRPTFLRGPGGILQATPLQTTYAPLGARFAQPQTDSWPGPTLRCQHREGPACTRSTFFLTGPCQPPRHAPGRPRPSARTPIPPFARSALSVPALAPALRRRCPRGLEEHPPLSADPSHAAAKLGRMPGAIQKPGTERCER